MYEEYVSDQPLLFPKEPSEQIHIYGITVTLLTIPYSHLTWLQCIPDI